MRKLNTSDVFKLFRILKKAGLIEEYKNMLQLSQDGAGNEAVGRSILPMIFDALSNEKTEQDVYDLLGNIAEVSADDIKNKDLDSMEKLLVEIKGNNNVLRFFNFVASLTKA